ncbi:MAG: glycoside hydrolase family 2 protein [Lentisphaerae bacterium]|nr:glycoside hydrolase family 2 protein [Lentisphaerota bacterium]
MNNTMGRRDRRLMDANWKFHLEEAKKTDQDGVLDTYATVKAVAATGPASPAGSDRDWRMVNLPHDWVVEGAFDPNADMSHGYLPAGLGWYRRWFHVPKETLGKRTVVEFDGVFRNCDVWANGHHMGRHLSGYTGFRFELTDVLNYGGNNLLTVRVDAREFEGWWYEGAGIYRHVWLTTMDPLHIAPWGVFVSSTVKAGRGGSTAAVKIQTELKNTHEHDVACRLVSTLLDTEGREKASASVQAVVPADGGHVCVQTIPLRNPALWSLENPALYRVVSRVEVEGETVDGQSTPFGIRTIRFDADKGFFLNGRPVKIQGCCNHQDHGGLGVALPDRVQEYRIERLKAMGCNAYRCAHNPPAPELLDACDRLGMLVMDENRKLNSSPEGLVNMESMVRRDRNHPSVILWSLENEEYAMQASEVGVRIARSLKRLVRRLDPTRPVTAAMNNKDAWGNAYSKVLDVQGCNYFPQTYDDYRRKAPRQPVVASETSSTLSTRGIYRNDPIAGYVSAYDLNAPNWGATAEKAWRSVAERPYMSGLFVWTGFDYRGEPTPYYWPCISSHFGILDMCGFPKDNFYYYRAWWQKEPVLHILPHWTWPGLEGRELDVWCHSNCEEVELFLNDRSLGRQPVPRNGHVEWKVAYAPGALRARGFTKGVETAVALAETAGDPAVIRLAADRQAIRGDGEDVVMVAASVLDAAGRLVPWAASLIGFEVNEAGHVLGVCNGNPSSHEPDKASQRKAFNGLCMAIVQERDNPGTLIVRAESPGLRTGVVPVTVQPAAPRPFVPVVTF